MADLRTYTDVAAAVADGSPLTKGPNGEIEDASGDSSGLNVLSQSGDGTILNGGNPVARPRFNNADAGKYRLLIKYDPNLPVTISLSSLPVENAHIDIIVDTPYSYYRRYYCNREGDRFIKLYDADLGSSLSVSYNGAADEITIDYDVVRTLTVIATYIA